LSRQFAWILARNIMSHPGPPNVHAEGKHPRERRAIAPHISFGEV
jgi:hypothetical protein